MGSGIKNFVGPVQIGDGANVADITTLRNIKDGDLFMLADGVPIVTTAAAQALTKNARIQIVAGLSGNKPRLSLDINPLNVSAYNWQDAVTRVNRIEYVGYDGTNAGTGIAVQDETEYRLRVTMKDSSRSHEQQITSKDIFSLTGTGATEEETLAEIVRLWYTSEYNNSMFNEKIRVSRYGDIASSSVSTIAIDVIQGSDLVTEVANTKAVGDLIRFGLTYDSPIYAVKEIVNANTYKLDIPYQDATATFAIGAADDITAIVDWGLKIEGLDVTPILSLSNNEPVDTYEFVDFTSSFADSDDHAAGQYSALVTPVDGVYPQGHWHQVADEEAYAAGYVGEQARYNYYDQRIKNGVVNDVYYNSVKILFTNTIDGANGNVVANPMIARIYIPTGSDQADTTGGNNEFTAILNGFFSTVLGFSPIAW